MRYLWRRVCHPAFKVNITAAANLINAITRAVDQFADYYSGLKLI